MKREIITCDLCELELKNKFIELQEAFTNQDGYLDTRTLHFCEIYCAGEYLKRNNLKEQQHEPANKQPELFNYLSRNGLCDS